jgi:hypothetical protein
MTNTKILQIQRLQAPPRIEFLEKNLPIWTQNKFTFEVYLSEALADEQAELTQFKHFLKHVAADAAGIFLEQDYSPVVISSLHQVPAKILEISTLDALLRDPAGRWWPHSYLKLALHEKIAERAPALDCTQIAYVTGDNFVMQVAVSVAVQLGFSSIHIVVSHPEQSKDWTKVLQRKYFGIEFKLISSSDLTLQKNNGSLLINTVDSQQSEGLMEDLSYLNFLLAGGLVVDLNILPLKNHLIEEATHVGLPVLAGSEVHGYTDFLVLKDAIPDFAFSKSDYMNSWSEFLISKPKV